MSARHLEELIADYATADHGIEVRQVAGGYRMSTKPEQHDRSAGIRQEPEASDSAVDARAGDAGRHCLQATGHGAGDQRNSRRGLQRRHRHAAGPQAGHHRRTQSRHRPADSLQDDQRISPALWVERCRRTAQHGGVREAGRGVFSRRLVAGCRRQPKPRPVPATAEDHTLAAVQPSENDPAA